MQIRELYIKNFGQFHEQVFLFEDGMNLIYGENEFGKSTIHEFIKAMLFGMERGRGRASQKGPYVKYEPWSNPNYYGGVLRFTCDGKSFCLERDFDRYAKGTSLVCEDDGEELSVEAGDLEMLLGGLTASNYENTVAIGQLRIEPNQELSLELKDYATNYYATGNNDIQLQGTIDVLKSKKKDIELQIKNMNAKKQEKQGKIEQESNYVWKDVKKITEEISRLNQEIELGKRESPKTEMKEVSEFKKIRIEKKWRIHPFVSFLMIVLVVAPFLILDRPWNYLWMVVIVLAEGLYIWNCLKDGKRNDLNSTEEKHIILNQDKGQEVQQKLQKRSEMAKKIEKCIWRKEHLQEELKEKQIMYSNLQENLQELDSVSNEHKELEKQKQGLELAIEKILELSKNINRGFGKALEEKASNVLRDITKGKYTRLVIDNEWNMFLQMERKRIGIEQVSRGTLEQVYFALRMAASEMVHEEELPVIMDETFAHYDEKRLESALGWLENNRRQILLFTCHKREIELLEKLEIPYIGIGS